MGGWLSFLLVELLVEGTICILAFYYIGYALSGLIIMHSEIIIIWPLSVSGILFVHLIIFYIVTLTLIFMGVSDICKAQFSIS